MTTGEMFPMHEEQREAQIIIMLEIGEGSIDPQTRVNNGEITDEEVDSFSSTVAEDRFQTPIDPDAIPDHCVDGRYEDFGPSAAGGTFSLVMADALTTESYRHGDEKASDHARRLYDFLLQEGYAIGGHGDDCASGDDSGCGAQDRLGNPKDQSILEYLTRRGDDVRVVIESLGIEMDDTLHAKITDKAQTLHTENYAATGAELRQAYIDVSEGDTAVVPDVKGSHKEVVLLINTQEATTLDREKVREELGEDCKVFNLDVPSLKKGTEAISVDAEEAQEKLVAALYYNVATTAVLAGPSLRVVVR